MTTKEQERKALAQIKKIVESLGEGSYVATAFEGCFEIAMENIENDFACSMKQRLESAELANKNLCKKLAEMQKECEDAYHAANIVAEEKDTQIDALQKRIISDDDLTDCISLARDRAAEYESMMDEAAEQIVELADDPGSVEFQDAVKSHRDAKRSKTYMDALKYRLARAADARRQTIEG